MENKSKKIKKEKHSAKIVVFDEADRENFLKSKFGCAKRKKQEYIERKEKKQKQMMRDHKREFAKERKEQMDKYRDMLEQRESVLIASNFMTKEKKTAKEKVKAGSQTFSITTTLL